jgi:chaperonin cofactor prefoldin
MEVRVARLEETMPRIEARLDRIETRLDRIEVRFDAKFEAMDVRLRGVEQGVARLDGKLDILTAQIAGKLPTWWQMLAVFVVLVAFLNGVPASLQYLHARSSLP